MDSKTIEVVELYQAISASHSQMWFINITTTENLVSSIP